MPDAGPQRQRDASAASRKADHAGIARLTEELLPALIAKLGTTNLGEIEVREGDWQIRLRRPSGNGSGSAPRSGEGRRATDKPSRAQPGHEGHGHGRAGLSQNGTGAPRSSAGRAGGDGTGAADRSRSVATSPAVGIFTPGTRAAAGTRVRTGDSLGTVNVIGVPQDVTAPVDGIVGSTLVEGGTAVEYGQELIRIELSAPAEAR